MTLFFYVVLGLFALDLFGKVCTLHRQDTYRNLNHVAVDAIIAAGMLVWGAFILGSA